MGNVQFGSTSDPRNFNYLKMIHDGFISNDIRGAK